MESIKKFPIFVGMGQSDDWENLGLTKQQCEILDDIGYGVNKNYGRDGIGFENFLNSISENEVYVVSYVRGDGHGYTSEYLVIKINLGLLEKNDVDKYKKLRQEDEFKKEKELALLEEKRELEKRLEEINKAV